MEQETTATPMRPIKNMAAIPDWCCREDILFQSELGLVGQWLAFFPFFSGNRGGGGGGGAGRKCGGSEAGGNRY